jgi:hypothetical protein
VFGCYYQGSSARDEACTRVQVNKPYGPEQNPDPLPAWSRWCVDNKTYFTKLNQCEAQETRDAHPRATLVRVYRSATLSRARTVHFMIVITPTCSASRFDIEARMVAMCCREAQSIVDCADTDTAAHGLQSLLSVALTVHMHEVCGPHPLKCLSSGYVRQRN